MTPHISSIFKEKQVMKINHRPPVSNTHSGAPTGRNICGIITNKMGRLVQFKSWAERSLLLRLERDISVTDYSNQPEQFEYFDTRGKRRSYTPDFIVWRGQERIEIHKITTSKRRELPEIKLREQASIAVCRQRGWHYLVHTEQSLPQGSELANLLVLFRFRPTAYANTAVIVHAQERLERRSPLLLHVLLAEITDKLTLLKPQVVASLGHMLWFGQLQTDLHQLLFVDGCLSTKALVWSPGSKEANCDTANA
jgi:hypothetical protein